MIHMLTVALLVVGLQDGKKDERAKMDEPVKDFKLKDVMQDEEKFFSLSDYKDRKAVVLFFVSDKCAVTWAYERRIGRLFEDFRKQDVAFLGISSGANDTPEQVRKYCEVKNFDLPVLFDDQGVAAYYDVRMTPIFCVIDKKGVLRFKGGLDDCQTRDRFREPDESVKTCYVGDALKAVLDGKEVATREFAAYG